MTLTDKQYHDLCFIRLHLNSAYRTSLFCEVEDNQLVIKTPLRNGAYTIVLVVEVEPAILDAITVATKQGFNELQSLMEKLLHPLLWEINAQAVMQNVFVEIDDGYRKIMTGRSQLPRVGSLLPRGV